MWQLEDAEPVCRRAVDMNPHNASALYNLGNVVCTLARSKRRSESMTESLRSTPNFPRTLESRAGLPGGR